jgi:hypothetical protein
MGKDGFSRDYSLTGIASSVLVGVDDKPVVENRMKVNGATLAGNLQKTGYVRTAASPFALFEAFFVASLVSLPETFVKTFSVASASCLFYIV